jgi:DNA (cytosine-5)-methyltransferase 1
MALIFGSVCSGIEAASVAWKPLGWRPSFVSEIEAFPRAVLAHHHPETPLHGDFTTIQAGQYEPIDLLVGGTPCQSFSIAGLRGGLADDRGNLALEYLRLADRLRPRWLVWENVPGVLSSNGGRDFGAILGGMVELGYGFAYRVLDAQFFGVAQRRRRVFVVGYLGDWRPPAAVLFERESLSGHPAPRREAGKGSAGGAPGGADGGDLARSLRARSNASHREDSDTYVPLISPHAFDARQSNVIQYGDRTGPLDTHGHTIGVMCFSSKDHGADAEIDLSPTLRAGGHDGSHANAGVPPAIAFALRGREGGAVPEVEGAGGRIGALRAADGGSSRDYVAFNITPSNSNKDYNARPSDRAQALTAGGNRPSARGGDLIAGSSVRRLTPRECERLQGFPDDYTLIPWRRGMSADGSRYKALGNSMAVPVMRHIGLRIQQVEDLCAKLEADNAA